MKKKIGRFYGDEKVQLQFINIQIYLLSSILN